MNQGGLSRTLRKSESLKFSTPKIISESNQSSISKLINEPQFWI
jgi:hypothetical protein